MSSISQQGGDSETARAIARPPFLFLVALLLGFVSDHLLPLPFRFRGSVWPTGSAPALPAP